MSSSSSSSRKRDRDSNKLPTNVELIKHVHDRLHGIAKKQKTLKLSNVPKLAGQLLGLAKSTVVQYSSEEDPVAHCMGNTSNHPILIPPGAEGHVRKYLRGRHLIHAWTTLSDIKAMLVEKEVINDDVANPTVRRYLNRIGYSWCESVATRKHFFEDPEKLNALDAYVTKLDEYICEGREIVYTDESYCHHHHRTNYGWFAGDDMNVYVNQKGNRVCIIGAGSKNGWITDSLVVFDAQNSKGDYHGNFDSALYQKWFMEKLIPNLPSPGCVIVMDSASYHLMKPADTLRVGGARKQVLTDYANGNSISFPPGSKVTELRQIVRSWIRENVKSQIEIYAEACGHTVMFQPKSFCELQAIEKVWAIGKGKVARHYRRGENGTKYLGMKAGITKALREVTDVSWSNIIDHVVNVGHKYQARYCQGGGQ